MKYICHFYIGYLSVVPVKSIVDQQRKWGIAIIQKKRLEQEKKRLVHDLESIQREQEQERKKLEHQLESIQHKQAISEEDVSFKEMLLDSASSYWEQQKEDLELQLSKALLDKENLIACLEMKNNEMASVATQTESRNDFTDSITGNGKCILAHW